MSLLEKIQPKVFEKVWAMPNRETFKIIPIKKLLDEYCKPKMIIVEPFANASPYGTITNDLNPEYKTTYNLDALEFLKLMKTESADLVLYDPPYSLTQAAECYKSFGKDKLEINVANMKYWKECKREAARITKRGGRVICFGWNSNGVGRGRDFTMERIMLVAHGGSQNDTIITVERKQGIIARKVLNG